MAEEIKPLISIDTQPAVESIADLKNNIKLLKKQLEGAKIGSDDYRKTLDQLKVNQNALKDAMYATSKQGETAQENMAALAKAATGTGRSYNALVHQMAGLKEQLRAVDTSTEAGKQRFKELASEIKNVNDVLKDMDAEQGNFQRNVGNYPGLVKTWAGALDGLDKGLKATTGGVGGMKTAMDGLAASPFTATIGIIVTLVAKLVGELQQNETAMAGIKKLMDGLQPVMDFFSAVLTKIAEVLGDVISKVMEFVQSNGVMQKIIDGVVGVGNAILQFIIAPVKAVIEAIKVFKEQGIKGFRDAAKAFGQEMKSGFAFKSNFQAGQAVGEALIAGAKSKKKDIVATGKDLGKDMGEAIAEGVKFTLQDFEKALSEYERRTNDARARYEAEQKDIDAFVDSEWAATNENIDNMFALWDEMDAQAAEERKQRNRDTIASLNAVAAATSSILSTIADMYESNEKKSEKNAAKIKALRIASATIDTLQGAIGAFASAAANPGGIPGMIIGAANAATITAAGIANIAKIRATKIGGAESSGGASVPAITAAPAVSTDVTNVRSLTTATEEQRLNQMASKQRVYILSSDIEASQDAIKTQVAEASF